MSRFKDEIQTLKFTMTGTDTGSVVAVKPSDWLAKWESKERDSKRWIDAYFTYAIKSIVNGRDEGFKDRVQGIFNAREEEESQFEKPVSDIRVIREIDNMTPKDISALLIEKVQKFSKFGMDITTDFFIVQLVRKKYNKQNNLVDEAIMMAIFYEIDRDDSRMVYIKYISRFWQGIDFQLDAQKRTHETYEHISSDVIFKRVLDNAKTYGCSVLKILIISKGSKDLLQRHLLERYFDKEWHKALKIHDEKDQHFPLKYLELRLCNECVTHLAKVGWKNTDYVFCGESCAKKKWKKGFQKK